MTRRGLTISLLEYSTMPQPLDLPLASVSTSANTTSPACKAGKQALRETPQAASKGGFEKIARKRCGPSPVLVHGVAWTL